MWRLIYCSNGDSIDDYENEEEIDRSTKETGLLDPRAWLAEPKRET